MTTEFGSSLQLVSTSVEMDESDTETAARLPTERDNAPELVCLCAGDMSAAVPCTLFRLESPSFLNLQMCVIHVCIHCLHKFDPDMQLSTRGFQMEGLLNGCRQIRLAAAPAARHWRGTWPMA